MSLAFLSAFFTAGGQQAMKGITTGLTKAAPELSIQAGQIVQEGKLDEAGDIIIRYRRDLQEAQAEFDTINGRYNQQVSTATVMQHDMEGYQATLNDPAKSDADKAAAQKLYTDTNESLSRLLAKVESMVPDLEHKKDILAQATSDLKDAETAYNDHAQQVVHGVEEAKEVRHEVERATREQERAQQKESDARRLAGLADDGNSSENPAIAAMRATAQKAKDAAEASNLKASALIKNSHHDDDDPIVKAAQERATDAPANSSVADRLAALQKKIAA